MGYILLGLLVITGFAGSLTESIDKKERRFAINQMKESKGTLFTEVSGLTQEALLFKPNAESWSVKECIYHIAISEKNLWNFLEATLKAPANPEKRTEIKVTDADFLKMIEDRSNKVKTGETFEPKNTPYQSAEEALNDFKKTRAEHIKYMKSTTEDLRNHVLQMPFGWIDCYQLYLMIAGHSKRHTQQIRELKNHPSFPKK
jgi:DinB superfamily